MAILNWVFQVYQAHFPSPTSASRRYRKSAATAAELLEDRVLPTIVVTTAAGMDIVAGEAQPPALHGLDEDNFMLADESQVQLCENGPCPQPPPQPTWRWWY